MKKRIAILGSTGSIGTQALQVVDDHDDLFEIVVLTAHHNYQLLVQQALYFRPQYVVIVNERYFEPTVEALSQTNINVLSGEQALQEIVSLDTINVVLIALVGFSGMLPTIEAIKHRKDIALANKETLVVGGEMIMQKVRQEKINLLPVDSEHSAIFQCLIGEKKSSVEKIFLTASGGPFFGKKKNELTGMSKEDALKHPTWNMGAKISIDSATLMNKGLEVIEAKWLFDVNFNQIEVVVHPQSIIHSMVQFEDGAIKAQLGSADMRHPILYAFGYPNRIASHIKRFDFFTSPDFTFHSPDNETFRNLSLAYECGEKGGNMPCILNAANEIAVSLFLEEKITFLEISKLIETCLSKVAYIRSPNIDDLIATDRETRIKALEKI